MADNIHTTTEQIDPAVFWKYLQSTKLKVNDSSIVVLEGPHEGYTLPLEREVTEVGRSELRHLALPKDKRISSFHAEIILTEQGVRVRDKNSRNGIFLDGHRIIDGYWSPDAKLQIGKTVMALRSSEGQKEIHVPYFDDSKRLVGKSSAMRQIFSMLTRLAGKDFPVLLTGETGTGKTSIAQALHEQSTRSDGPFVNVNCAAIHENLIEAELFGYEKGAFTDANKQHKGYFEQADKGTLLLDEIGELSAALQAKLLDAIERKRIRRLGAAKEVAVDFRLVTATHQNLGELIKTKQFREDLFYRIAVVELEVPALRERAEDLPLLVESLLKRVYTRNQVDITQAAFQKLQAYHWPGNIRQLRNILERSLLFLEGDRLDAQHIEFFSNIMSDPETKKAMEEEGDDASISEAQLQGHLLVPFLKENQRLSIKEVKEHAERLLIQRTLEEFHWKVSQVAEALGANRTWLYKQIDKYGLKKD